MHKIILINPKLLSSEVKNLKKMSVQSSTKVREEIIRSIGFADVNQYKSHKSFNRSYVHQQTSYVQLHELTYLELGKLENAIRNAAGVQGGHLDEPTVSFIAREIKRRREAYKSGKSLFRLSQLLSIAPMLSRLPFDTVIINSNYSINDGGLDKYIESIFERYNSPIEDFGTLLLTNTFCAQSRKAIAERYNLFELIAHISNTKDVDCGESFITKELLKYYKNEIDKEEFKIAITDKVHTEWEYLFILYSESCERPTLYTPEFSPIAEETTNSNLLSPVKNMVKKIAGAENENSTNWNSILGNPKVAFDIGTANSGDTVSISRGDLVEGLTINTSWGGSVLTRALIEMHIQKGGGLFYLAAKGDIAQRANILIWAELVNRARDVIYFNHQTVEKYLTPERIKSYILNGKIIYIDLSAVEKSPIDLHTDVKTIECLAEGLIETKGSSKSGVQTVIFTEERYMWGERMHNSFKRIRGYGAKLGMGFVDVETYTSGSNDSRVEKKLNAFIHQYKHRLLFVSEEDWQHPQRRKFKFSEFLYKYENQFVTPDVCEANTLVEWIRSFDTSKEQINRITLNNP